MAKIRNLRFDVQIDDRKYCPTMQMQVIFVMAFPMVLGCHMTYLYKQQFLH